MGPLLIIALLVVGLYVLTRASDRFGTWVGGPAEDVLGRRVDARVARLRAAARAPNRPPGSPVGTEARLRAGLVDFGGALALGLVFTLLMGFATTTTTYTDATTKSGMALDFSFLLFVLLVLVCYAGIGYRAAEFDDEGQTFGQRLLDYAPRDSGGQRLSMAAGLKRHMLRLAAAPEVLIAMAQGRSVEPEHDRWTGTSAGTLGEPVPRPSWHS